MDWGTVAVWDKDIEAVQRGSLRGAARSGAFKIVVPAQTGFRVSPARKIWRFCLSQRRICSLHAPNLQLLVFSRLFTAHPKNTIPASTTQSLAKYMTSMDDWARTRSSATNREIFSEFDKPNFLQFVQSGGLIHDTLFRFGTVFVVKRHALLDCLSLLVSSTTGLTIAKRFRSKLSQPKLSLVHHDRCALETQDKAQAKLFSWSNASLNQLYQVGSEMGMRCGWKGTLDFWDRFWSLKQALGGYCTAAKVSQMPTTIHIGHCKGWLFPSSPISSISISRRLRSTTNEDVTFMTEDEGLEWPGISQDLGKTSLNEINPRLLQQSFFPFSVLLPLLSSSLVAHPTLNSRAIPQFRQFTAQSSPAASHAPLFGANGDEGFFFCWERVETNRDQERLWEINEESFWDG
ncbi:hypothetical protein C8J56DRAFT_897848 [Mycena floridula]|nr:hypothetical protein C8J56DRAFT_897848 [Mycena floridula]